MVRRGLILGAVTLLGLLGAQSTPAASIPFTGNVEKDFPNVAGNGVVITPDSAILHATLPPWMIAAGRGTGLDFKDIRLAYDQASDTLAVGVNFKGIGGDIDGNGAVGSVDSIAAGMGTFEPSRFGNLQTVAFGFDFNKSGTPQVVVGIPLNKPVDSATGKPLDGVKAFTIAKYQDNPAGLPNGFGSSTVGSVNLLSHLGRRSVETSAAKPDMEFEITKVSEIGKLFDPKFDPTKGGLAILGFSSDIQAPMVGKTVAYYNVKAFQAQVPEPATLLAWSAVMGGLLAYRTRRRNAAV